MWDHPQFLESPESLKKWLKEKTRQLTKGSYGSARRAVNMLDDDLDGNAELDEELNALGDVPDGELMAYVRKFYQRRPARPGEERKPQASGARVRGQREGGGREQRDAPPRGIQDARCPNCLELGHTSRECKKPRKQMSNRACFHR